MRTSLLSLTLLVAFVLCAPPARATDREEGNGIKFAVHDEGNGIKFIRGER